MSAYFDSLNRRQPLEVLKPVGGRPSLALAPVRRLAPPEIPAEYRALRERLLAVGPGGPIKTVVFAGCEGGEGATHVVREFAEVLASSGLNVLLVDADLRSAGLTRSLGATGEDLGRLAAAGRAPAAAPWGRGTLTVVPSSPSPSDAGTFLGEPGLAAWLDGQRQAHDYVLLDAPPILQFADAALLGRLCDALVVVVRAGATAQKSLARIGEHLAQAGVHVLGAVLNRVHDPLPALLRRQDT